MIEVTEAMVDAFDNRAYGEYDQITGNAELGLEAVFALIDSVPDEVREGRIVRGDWEFTRIMSGEDQNVPTNLYRSECGCHYYTYQQIMEAAALEESTVEWS